MLGAMQQRVTSPAAASQQVRCSLHSSKRLGSVACTSSFKAGRCPQLSRAHTFRQSRNVHVVRAGLGDVGKYLSEAAAATFTSTKEDVPWSGGNFSGKVSHHEGDVPRLKRLYKAVRETREQLAGCMDPSASNYDPSASSESGACTYLYEDPETGSKQEGSLGQFVSTTISSLFGNKGDKNGPNWEGSGYAYSGDIVSQRDIDRLLRYEGVVKETLQKAEAAAKE